MLRVATHSICLCHDHMAQYQPHGITIGTLDAVIMDSLPQDYGSVQADPVFETITGVQYSSISHDDAGVGNMNCNALSSEEALLVPLTVHV